MQCLIISATSMEITPFLRLQREIKNDWDLDILVTGAGLTATTYSLVRQVSIKRPNLMIQVGLAGSFLKTRPLTSVVAVKRETIADQGVIEDGELLSLFDLGLIKKSKFPYDRGWLNNPHQILLRASLPIVDAVSVNEISTSKQKIRLYREKYSAELESMEGAALHYTGLMEHIPFLQLRAVSNYVGERNKSKWEIVKAIENLNRELVRVLNEL